MCNNVNARVRSAAVIAVPPPARHLMGTVRFYSEGTPSCPVGGGGGGDLRLALVVVYSV